MEHRGKYGSEKPRWSCYYIERGMVCVPEDISFCCQRSCLPISIQPDKDPGKTVDNFLKMKQTIIELNQTDETPCKGCELLQYRVWESKNEIERLNFSTHSYCQFSCIYCDLQKGTAGNKNKEEHYDCIEIARELKRRSMLSEKLVVECSPGEITIHPRRQEFYDFIEKNAFSTVFASNAGVFDERLACLMQKKKCDLLVSIDSGTTETFKKVRGIDLFYKVRDNLKKYREYSSNILLKYIILSENCQKKDLDGFIELCKEIKPAQMILAGDYHKSEGVALNITVEEDIVEAATYLCKRAIEEHISFRFEDNLGRGNVGQVYANLKRLPEVEWAKTKMKNLLEKKNLIFYGAGGNAEILIRKFEAIGLRKPDNLWDKGAKTKFNKYGYVVSPPAFETLGEDDAVFITIVNEEVNQNIKDVMQSQGFNQVMSQYEIALALIASN